RPSTTESSPRSGEVWIARIIAAQSNAHHLFIQLSMGPGGRLFRRRKIVFRTIQSQKGPGFDRSNEVVCRRVQWPYSGSSPAVGFVFGPASVRPTPAERESRPPKNRVRHLGPTRSRPPRLLQAEHLPCAPVQPFRGGNPGCPDAPLFSPAACQPKGKHGFRHS